MSSLRCEPSGPFLPTRDAHVHRRELEHPPDRRRAGLRRRLRRAHDPHWITRGAHRVHRTRVLQPAASPACRRRRRDRRYRHDLGRRHRRRHVGESSSPRPTATQVAESGGSDTVAAVLATHPYRRRHRHPDRRRGLPCRRGLIQVSDRSPPTSGTPDTGLIPPRAGSLRRDRRRRRDRRVRPPRLPHLGVGRQRRHPLRRPPRRHRHGTHRRRRHPRDHRQHPSAASRSPKAASTDTFTAVLGNQPEGDVVVEFPGAGGPGPHRTRTVHQQQLERAPRRTRSPPSTTTSTRAHRTPTRSA